MGADYILKFIHRWEIGEMAKRAKKTASESGKRQSRKPKTAPEKHARHLVPAAKAKAYITEIIATKNATSEAGQGLSTATRQFQDAGGNAPAARIAARIYSKAKQDSIKGRVLFEDIVYYLTKCTDFDRIAPEGMFTPEESGIEAQSQPHDMNEGPEEELPIIGEHGDAEAEMAQGVVTH